MRRFIYLDTDTLNSYIAQMYDGVIQTESIEIQNTESKEDEKKKSGSITGGFDFSFFGRGGSGNGTASLENFHSIKNEDILRDVQTKMLHDNAFDWLMNYLESEKLFLTGTPEIGKYLSIEDEFYIFDLDFYKRLVEKDGLMYMVTEIQIQTATEQLQSEFDALSREERRNKEKKDQLDTQKKEIKEKSEKEIDTIRKLVDIFSMIIPYHQILCIQNYLVVLNPDFLRDAIETAAFKYGGRVKVVGFVSNKIASNIQSPVNAFASVGGMVNNIMTVLFPDIQELFVVHPIAIYYDN